MSTNSISHTDPSPSSYTPPKTSRFLACGKLNPKYPEGLGKSVPSTFSGWPKFTREVPQPTLSPLASLLLPHTASGSYASESTLGSVENSPLQPKSSLLAHQKKLVVDEQVSAGDDPLELGAGSLQLENSLPLNPVQESVSSLAIISLPKKSEAFCRHSLYLISSSLLYPKAEIIVWSGFSEIYTIH